jgi:chloramphenicol 3-O-phosphotransferase
MTGTLIVVTGTTGAGKTTTCREFVSRHDDLWLHFGVDTFLGVLTPRQFVDGGPRSAEGVHMEPDDLNNPEGPAHLALGRYGAAMIHTMHEMAAAALRTGQNIIMDHITTMNPPLLQDCVAVLHRLPVLFVALRPPAEMINARIDARIEEVMKTLGPEHGKRTNEGTKRVSNYMAREIYSHDCFDMMLDTGSLSPSQVAAAISTRLQEGTGQAFTLLAKKFGL